MICPSRKLEGLAGQAEWIDAQLIAETQQVWEPIYGRALTIAEAVEILHNIGRLVDALQG